MTVDYSIDFSDTLDGRRVAINNEFSKWFERDGEDVSMVASNVWGYVWDSSIDTFTYEFVNEIDDLSETFHKCKANSDFSWKMVIGDQLLAQTMDFELHDSGREESEWDDYVDEWNDHQLINHQLDVQHLSNELFDFHHVLTMDNVGDQSRFQFTCDVDSDTTAGANGNGRDTVFTMGTRITDTNGLGTRDEEVTVDELASFNIDLIDGSDWDSMDADWDFAATINR